MRAAAEAAGCGENDSWLDYVEAQDHEFQTAIMFPSRAAAVEWLKSEIAAEKTVFGCGDVTEGERLARPERCRYCTCHGWRPKHRYVVDDSGICEDHGIDDCAN